MGKASKGKKYGRSSHRQRGKQQPSIGKKGVKTDQKEHQREATKPKLDTEHVSLYRIYKHSTEAVIRWGKSTFQQIQSKQPRKGTKAIASSATTSESLSQVIFGILASLADQGITMPELVLRDLEVAISYRQKVQEFYQALPQVGEEEYQRHRWIIGQLQALHSRFLRNNNNKQPEQKQHKVKQTQSTSEQISTSSKGFDVLALSDDEEESVGGFDDENETRAIPTVKNNTIPAESTPGEVAAEDAKLATEDRHFAIALFLFDVDMTRQNVRQRWKKWAQHYIGSINDGDSRDDTEKTKDLIAVTAATEYAISSTYQSILQMSLEIDGFTEDELATIIIQSYSKGTTQTSILTKQSFQKGDRVTLVGLENRSDLNGRQGVIIGECGRIDRCPVELVESPPTVRTKANRFFVRTKNIISSDSTLNRLGEIYYGIYSMHVRTETSSISTDEFFPFILLFQTAAKNQDFQTALKLIIKNILPTLISMTKSSIPFEYGGFLFRNLRIFQQTQKVDFSLAFALLALVDSALDTACANVLAGVPFVTGVAAKRLFEGTFRAIGTDTGLAESVWALLSKADIARRSHPSTQKTEILRWMNIIPPVFPFALGTFSLDVFRMHHLVGRAIVHSFRPLFLHILHIYWLLRVEGHLGRIPELESAVALFPQQFFFPGGPPSKGHDRAFTKGLGLAVGMTVGEVQYLIGKPVPSAKKRDSVNLKKITNFYEGLRKNTDVQSIDILQWISHSIEEKGRCLDEIELVARKKADMFLTPLFEVFVKVRNLEDTLLSQMAAHIDQSGSDMIQNFAHLQIEPIYKASLWAMYLGDDISKVVGEKDRMLRMMALLFSRAFQNGVEPADPTSNEKPTLVFDSSETMADPSTWGKEGANNLQRHFYRYVKVDKGESDIGTKR